MRKGLIIFVLIFLSTMSLWCLEYTELYYGDFDNNGVVDVIIMDNEDLSRDGILISMNGDSNGVKFVYYQNVKYGSGLVIDSNNDSNLDFVFQSARKWYAMYGNGLGALSDPEEIKFSQVNTIVQGFRGQ